MSGLTLSCAVERMKMLFAEAAKQFLTFAQGVSAGSAVCLVAKRRVQGLWLALVRHNNSYTPRPVMGCLGRHQFSSRRGAGGERYCLDGFDKRYF